MDHRSSSKFTYSDGRLFCDGGEEEEEPEEERGADMAEHARVVVVRVEPACDCDL